MNVSKENIAMVFLSFALFITFIILITAFKGDKNLIKISLAGFGFIGFACLYVALICAKFKIFKS